MHYVIQSVIMCSQKYCKLEYKKYWKLEYKKHQENIPGASGRIYEMQLSNARKNIPGACINLSTAFFSRVFLNVFLRNRVPDFLGSAVSFPNQGHSGTIVLARIGKLRESSGISSERKKFRVKFRNFRVPCQVRQLWLKWVPSRVLG